jgi:hypothetical protein
LPALTGNGAIDVQNKIISKGIRAALIAATLAAGIAQAAPSDSAPQYIFPGLGTLVAALLALVQ